MEFWKRNRKTRELKIEIAENRRKNKLLKDKKVRDKIKKLLQDEQYDEIFSEYGFDAFHIYVPRKYKKNDLEKLKKEGRYESIYAKYGEIEYQKILTIAQYNEIKQELGNASARVWRAKHSIANFFKRVMKKTISGALALTVWGELGVAQVQDSKEKYTDEIQIYNENIREYSKLFEGKKYSDIQIIMKVMDDMWNSIEGYKSPDTDPIGFSELSLQNDGYGVCRNFASDISKKLNIINPKFNARVITVKLGHEGEFSFANIERNILEENETVSQDSNENKEIISITDLFGNHAITLVDIPEDNIILAIDPTNPALGIYRNGKIYMFNGPNVKYDNKALLVSTWFRGRFGYRIYYI